MPKHVVHISPNHMDPEYAIERRELGDDVELRSWSATDDEALGRELRDAEAIMTWRVPFRARVIEQLEACRLIIRIGVGFDTIDLDAAKARGIAVCNVPDYCTDEVADHTIGLLLAISRGIIRYNDNMRAGNERWGWSGAAPLYRLAGKRLGVIGLGRIGTAVARRAAALGLDVAFHDPYVPDGTDKALGLRRLELPELLGGSDVVTFHTPLTDETRRMANAGFFAELKPGAIVLNTSRGAVIDVDALEAAMREGTVAAAGLDVLPVEPPSPEPGLIRAWRAREEWVRDRLVYTPHSAFYSEESEMEMRAKAARTVREALDGKPIRNRVNP